MGAAHIQTPPPLPTSSGLEEGSGTGGGWAGAPCPLSLSHAFFQVFYPRENFSHPYSLRLLCEQVRARPTCDTYRQSAPTPGPHCCQRRGRGTAGTQGALAVFQALPSFMPSSQRPY